MPAFIYRCPIVCVHVHAWTDEEPEGRTFACSATHIVNPTTGRVIGADEDGDPKKADYFKPRTSPIAIAARH